MFKILEHQLALLENSTCPPLQCCPITKLQIGVFFDGTNNNADLVDVFNSLPAREKENYKGRTEYENGYSNIYRMHKLYRTDDKITESEKLFVRKIYIEGIGTYSWRPALTGFDALILA